MNGRVKICDGQRDRAYLSPQGSTPNRRLDQAGCCDKIINEPGTKSVETYYDDGKKCILPVVDAQAFLA